MLASLHTIKFQKNNADLYIQGVSSHCLSSSSVLGAGSLYVVSSTIVQMVSRGLTSSEFAGRSSLGIKFANPSDTKSA